jgi:hypothetical protein
MLSFACIYDMLPIWDCLYSNTIRPNALLRNIVSTAVLDSERILYYKETLDAILDVYEAVSRLDRLVDADEPGISAEVDTVLSFARSNNSLTQTEHSQEYDSKWRINLCCQLSAQLLWNILRRPRQSRGHAEPIQNTTDNGESEIERILKHIQQVEPLYWITHAPDVFTWIVFTGAAASSALPDRVAFISRAGTVLTAVDGESLSLIRQGWRYFWLLRRLGGLDEPHTARGED